MELRRAGKIMDRAVTAGYRVRARKWGRVNRCKAKICSGVDGQVGLSRVVSPVDIDIDTHRPVLHGCSAPGASRCAASYGVIGSVSKLPGIRSKGRTARAGGAGRGYSTKDRR